MKLLLFSALMLMLAAMPVRAQDLEKRAGENPLDCYLYLLSLDDDPISYQAESLASAYIKVERWDDAARAVEMLKDEEDKSLLYLKIHENLIKEKQIERANEFLSKSFIAARKSRSDDGEMLLKLVVRLAAADLHNEATEIVNDISDTEDKLEILVSLTDFYLNSGQNEKAQTFLSNILPTARASEWTDYTVWGLAEAGRFHARLKEAEKALELLNQARHSAFSIEYENRLQDDILLALIEGFTAANQLSTAMQLWKTYGDSTDENDKIKLVQILKAHGNLKEAALYSADLWQPPESIGAFVDGDYVKALELTKTASDDYDDSSQQSMLLRIAEKQLETGKTATALDAINFAFERAVKIDASEPELPIHSHGATTGSRKAMYLLGIVDGYAKAKSFEKALLAANAIHKPNYQAIALARLAARQSKSAASKIVFNHLTRALRIVRTAKDAPLDRNKTDAFKEIAVAYAATGANEKAAAVFAEALQNVVEDGDESQLLEIGAAMEKAKIKTDANIQKLLREIIEKES